MLGGCEGPAGKDGADGVSCTVTDNGDGTSTIACDDGTNVVVKNGTDGTDGNNGTDGTSCTVTDNNDGTKTVSCDDGTSVTVTDGGNCTVTNNGNGSYTITCADGTTVTLFDGSDGTNGGNVEVTAFHGSEYLTAEELAAGKQRVKATITSATADAAGAVTVNFDVEDLDGNPVTWVSAINANIAKLVPPGATDAANHWVPYIYRKQTVTNSASNDWPNPDGTEAYQAYLENTGTLTNNNDGTYSYTFATDLTTAMQGTTAIAYERDLTHRISIMMGGHAGPTADAVFDFVPDGSPLTEKRDPISTSSCKSCHGESFAAHGGDRLSVENCATCHVPGNVDPQSGESLDLKTMIHKIHAGGEVASIPGPDGVVWDNPATPTDESADNGEYAIWGYQDKKSEWWKVEFPAVVENCQKCHTSAASQADNWKTKPSRAACGSCHDDVDFATGTNHPGGIQTGDNDCDVCHKPTGTAAGKSITLAHDWTDDDPRNIPEFQGAIQISTPANGQYFVAGESPVVTVVLSKNGVAIDHNTVVEDPTGEGCLLTGCPPADGLFRNASFFVHGPRNNATPVLTTSARSQILSTSSGPFDLSAAGASLIVQFDRGQNLTGYDSSGGDLTIAGTVTVPVAGGTFGVLTAATTDEVVTWLNANAAFKARGIAFNQGGKVGIRSRNLGRVHALQLQASAVATSVFAGDLNVKMPAGSTTSNNISKRTVPANNDPKVAWTTGGIVYTLDPVDDLTPGTYTVNIEMTDRGRIDAANYNTPTVAKATFQVKQAAEEPLVANNCNSCHESEDGRGYVLDWSRHNKIFDNTATDQCTACHDYQPQNATGTTWTGARPINRRVHGIHFGSSLYKPLATVDYANGDSVPGRNWDITFPQDVRNCETCHTAQTSGTWQTQAARLPCSGCHDSDAALAHFRIMTWDPTPTDPWSGDEEESCTSCH
ncbi:MAG: OmcA/MtrC family decaheme c-type cytochrome [Polyangiaceae bacterium]